MKSKRAAMKGRMVGSKEVLALRPDLGSHWKEIEKSFPIRITRSFWERGDPEDPEDPLLIQVLPSREELRQTEGDQLDPVGEKAHSPVPWVVHKYPDRVLLMMTKRCHVYCRYCFRRSHSPEERLDPTPEAWDRALSYVESSGAKEVILSGGDPLAVSSNRLFSTIDRLRDMDVVIRIHTRAPITCPDVITPEFVKALRDRQPLWVIVHVNHSKELNEDVDRGLSALVDGGVPVLNQSVLLRGVNDNVSTLVALCQDLVKRRVFPYYLHHPDAVEGNSHFRVSLEDGRELYSRLREQVSGIACPRYVLDPPEGTGKIGVMEG
jgi:lysine 2,3-aminomutase